MRLLSLHGPPASGKRTVGQAIVHRIGGRRLDNHAAVDFARTVLDFDAPGFWDLVHSARVIAFKKAAEHGVPSVVTEQASAADAANAFIAHCRLDSI